MSKEPKTALELRAMILSECADMAIHSLGVYGDGNATTWYTIVVAPPNLVGSYTAYVNQVADRLRTMYDLIEEYEFRVSGFTFFISGDLLRQYAAERGDNRGGLNDLAETYKPELMAAAARAIDGGVHTQRIEIRQI